MSRSAGPASGTPVVFSADDYGIAPATSAVLRDLLASRRLSATSAMTVFPDWDVEGRRLAPLGDAADLGLHLVLTDHAPLTSMASLAPDGRLPSFPALARRAYAGKIDPGEVERELHAQLDAFEGAVGRPPDHLDGHHHVQQLPGVSEAVVRVATGRLGGRAWVRTCAEPVADALRRRSGLPRALAFGWASRRLAAALDEASVPRPAGFVGAYGFDQRVPYLDRLVRFLSFVRPGTVLMLHPGAVDDDLRARDSLLEPRVREAEALADPRLPALLSRLGVRIARLREVGG